MTWLLWYRLLMLEYRILKVGWLLVDAVGLRRQQSPKR